MAVGMVSSASSLGVLRIGETATTSPTALKDKNAKTYHHMIKGARFIMPDGLEIVFMGGVFSTTDKEIIAELDKVADKPASMIFTRKEVAEAITAQTAKVAAEAVTQ